MNMIQVHKDTFQKSCKKDIVAHQHEIDKNQETYIIALYSRTQLIINPYSYRHLIFQQRFKNEF